VAPQQNLSFNDLGCSAPDGRRPRFACQYRTLMMTAKASGRASVPGAHLRLRNDQQELMDCDHVIIGLRIADGDRVRVRLFDLIHQL
jgi:hypothetical protein